MWRSNEPSAHEAGAGAEVPRATPEGDGLEPVAEARRRGPLATVGALLGGLLRLAALAAAGATVAGFAPRASWACELADANRVPLLGLLALAALVELARRRWFLALAGLLLGAANALPLVPLWRAPEAPPPAGVRNLRLVVLNVHARNERTEPALEWVRGQEADVVVLLEVTDAWARAIEAELADAFPQRLVVPRADNFGVALLTRLRARGLEERTGPAGVPAIDARLQIGVDVLRLLAVHPPPPFGAELVGRRDAELASLAADVAATDGPVVLAGDFNAPPWSYAVEPLRAEGLRRLRAGRALAPTWPAHLAGGHVPPWVPLDGAWATDEVLVTGYAVGRFVGSDHRPVTIDLLLR